MIKSVAKNTFFIESTIHHNFIYKLFFSHFFIAFSFTYIHRYMQIYIFFCNLTHCLLLTMALLFWFITFYCLKIHFLSINFFHVALHFLHFFLHNLHFFALFIFVFIFLFTNLNVICIEVFLIFILCHKIMPLYASQLNCIQKCCYLLIFYIPFHVISSLFSLMF